MSNDLLRDPVLTVRDVSDVQSSVSLADVLAGLWGGTLDDFCYLQPHQRHGWHAFLVQLAALALCRSGAKPPEAASGWRDLLMDLAGGHQRPGAWRLVEGDVKEPAFMQPPVPEAEGLKGYKNRARRPDEIDILVTAKNHDVKMARIKRPRTDHWIYALVTVQTMQGFSGKNNYGVSRMNGGFGSRPCVTLIPEAGHAACFRRDLAVLQDRRQHLLEEYPFYAGIRGGSLLWLEPWDGLTSRPIDGLDPYYIEVARRIRLIRTGGSIEARLRPTAVPFLAAKELLGNTGDPWTPVKKSTATALTVPGDGFDYRKLCEVVLDPEYVPGICLHARDDDPDGEAHLFASVLVRGQGKTEGFHERRVPWPKAARDLFASASGREQLAEISKSQIEDASTLRRKVLRPALLRLAQGGPDSPSMEDVRVGPWTRAFDRQVDRQFFPALWSSLETASQEPSPQWRKLLAEMGRDVLLRAERALPIPHSRRHRAVARAESYFQGALNRHFPELSPRGASR